MEGTLARIRSVFIEAPTQRVSVAQSVDYLPSVGLLCEEKTAPSLAVSVGQVLCKTTRAKTALVCLVGGTAEQRWRAGLPSSAATRRLVSRLNRRDFHATGAGQTAKVAIPGNSEQSVLQVTRLLASVDCPTVVSVIGPRTTAIDQMLTARDLLLVVKSGSGQESLSTRLAYESLEVLGPPVEQVGYQTSALIRAFTGVGFSVPGATPSALKTALARVK